MSIRVVSRLKGAEEEVIVILGMPVEESCTAIGAQRVPTGMFGIEIAAEEESRMNRGEGGDLLRTERQARKNVYGTNESRNTTQMEKEIRSLDIRQRGKGHQSMGNRGLDKNRRTSMASQGARSGINAIVRKAPAEASRKFDLLDEDNITIFTVTKLLEQIMLRSDAVNIDGEKTKGISHQGQQD